MKKQSAADKIKCSAMRELKPYVNYEDPPYYYEVQKAVVDFVKINKHRIPLVATFLVWMSVTLVGTTE